MSRKVSDSSPSPPPTVYSRTRTGMWVASRGRPRPAPRRRSPGSTPRVPRAGSAAVVRLQHGRVFEGVETEPRFYRPPVAVPRATVLRMWRRSPGPAARLPDLIGLEVRVAQDLALDAGMLAVVAGPRSSSAGSRVVTGQSPRPGRRVRVGSKVWIQVGPDRVEPDDGPGNGAEAGARGFRRDLDRGPRPGTSRLRDNRFLGAGQALRGGGDGCDQGPM
jgi:hypothetical protein